MMRGLIPFAKSDALIVPLKIITNEKITQLIHIYVFCICIGSQLMEIGIFFFISSGRGLT